MGSQYDPKGMQTDIERLVAELEEAEAYEQTLRQFIVDVRAQLASGNSERALSMLNEALSYIDNATDVVSSSRAAPH